MSLKDMEIHDLAHLRRVLKDDEGNSVGYDPYVVACRLVLEKADAFELATAEIAGMQIIGKALADEFRRILVGAVILGHTELSDINGVKE